MSFFSSLTDRDVIPALVATMSFSDAKLGVIAENVANVETPGYRAKQLDSKVFQGALRKALDNRGDDYRKPLWIDNGDEVRTSRLGRLEFHPSQHPVQNALFHDGTNLSIEQQMAELAETGMMHELSAKLLREEYDELRKAIRGTA